MSTSKLQKYTGENLNKFMSEFLIYENARPAWLGGLELDFYLPEIDVAIEVQGMQHLEFTPRFHKTYKDFLAQQVRDERKKELCENQGTKLYEVFLEQDADILVTTLFEKFHKALDKPEIPYAETDIFFEYEKKSHEEKKNFGGYGVSPSIRRLGINGSGGKPTEKRILK